MVKIKCLECNHISEPFDGDSTKDLRYIECENCGRFIENPLFVESKEVNYVN